MPETIGDEPGSIEPGAGEPGGERTSDVLAQAMRAPWVEEVNLRPVEPEVFVLGM